jgi:hypothetical protein
MLPECIVEYCRQANTGPPAPRYHFYKGLDANRRGLFIYPLSTKSCGKSSY